MGRRELVIYNAFDFLGEEADMGTLADRILFQKKVYFLQQFAGGLDYDFGWHKYGPYIYDVTVAGYTIQAWQNTEIQIPEIEGLSNEALERYKDFLKDCKEMPGHDEGYWLELASSLHFLYDASMPHPEGRQETFRVLEVVKPAKFSQEDKEKAWGLLREYGLVDN